MTIFRVSIFYQISVPPGREAGKPGTGKPGSALPWLGWLACCALPRLGLPALTSSKRSKSSTGLETTTQPPSAAGGGCAAAVVVSKPLPLLDLLEQVKTRQTEPRQGTASEPAEPRQSTRGEVAEPSQATLSARTTTAAAKPPHSRRRRLCCCSGRECCLAWLSHLAWSVLPWLAWLACCALPRLGLPCLDLL